MREVPLRPPIDLVSNVQKGLARVMASAAPKHDEHALPQSDRQAESLERSPV
jgi:hypothetical protein